MNYLNAKTRTENGRVNRPFKTCIDQIRLVRFIKIGKLLYLDQCISLLRNRSLKSKSTFTLREQSISRFFRCVFNRNSYSFRTMAFFTKEIGLYHLFLSNLAMARNKVYSSIYTKKSVA